MQLVKPEEVLVIDDTPTTEIKNTCEKYVAEFCKVGVALVYVRKTTENVLYQSLEISGQKWLKETLCCS